MTRLRRRFLVVRSTHRETIRRGESAARAVVRNAAGKARHARLPRGASGIVIGADTLLWFRGCAIGKPRTMRQALQWLRALQGNSHWVYTGLCLMDPQTHRCRTASTRSRVTFRPVGDAALTRLLARMRPLDKAGGYAAQGAGGQLIARIQGSRTNVIGLPLECLRRELAAFERRRRRNRY